MINRILQAVNELNKMGVSLSMITSLLCSTVMIFGGVLPYIPQYREIKKTQNADGFSLFVCLSLLLANSMRILFWFGHPFELPLLFQSIIMNLTTLTMIHLCLKVKQRSQIIPTQPQTFTDFNVKHFWAWTDFFSYVEFLATFSTAVGLIMYLFIEVSVVVEGIGLLSLLSEAMLGAPQFYRNFINKSTLGMSKKMVLMWSVGDIYKTCYFIIKEVPIQFWICGFLQVTIDLAIMIQIWLYKSTLGNSRFAKPTKHIS